MKNAVVKLGSTICAMLLIIFVCLWILPADAQAASTSDLTFKLSADGESYYVYDCSQYASGAIVIPATYNNRPVTRIGNRAFYGCDSLTSITIPDSVTSIGSDAFYKCTGLTSITIPDSVTSIGNDAFSYCDSLTSVTIGNSVTSIGDYTFYDCKSLTSITIPDSVTSIGNDAFSYCDSLTSVTIGNSVTSIGNFAFYRCYSLTSITIPDSVTSIGDYAFYDCYSLISATIGNSVTSIGNRAFSSCYSLTSITIPDSVTSISSDVFENCKIKKLIIAEGSKTVTATMVVCENTLQEIVIPDSVTSISSDVFENCKIKKLTIAEGSKTVTATMVVCENTLQEIVIPDSVTSIGDYTFYDCKSLTSITIPDSVTSIGDYAFRYCDSLTSITIPDSVTIIGDYAFYKCTALTSITIPDSVTSVGYGIFQDCKNLKFNIYDNAKYLGNTQNPYVVLFRSITDNITNCQIPLSTKLIADEAFRNCTSLTSITIPDSVTSIGDYAFRYCDSLTSITIPDSVTIIGDYAFSYCDSLTSITIPDSVTSIGSCAFSGCSGLTSITIPDSVTSIGDYAFYYCENLTSITIPDSVTIIGDYAFRYCDSLTSITIPDSVTSIGDYAFDDCDSLTSVTIGNSVTSIGDYAFYDCDSLISITIPDSVTSIGSAAFYNCSKLKFNDYDGCKYLGNSNNPYMFLVEAIAENDRQYNIHEDTRLIASNVFDSVEIDTILFLGNVPYISDRAFYGVTASVYTKEPWDENKLRDYAGDIIWKSGADRVEYSVSSDKSRFYGISQPIEISKVIATYTFANKKLNAEINGTVQLGHYDNSTAGKKQVSFYVDGGVGYFDYVVVGGNDIEVTMPNFITFGDDEIDVDLQCYGEPLVEGVDYKVSHKNNNSVGIKAEISFIGLGVFEGWNRNKNYAILKKDLSEANVSVADCYYNGDPQKPTASVSLGDISLKENEDYIIRYIDNVKLGTATVQIYGIGNYTGVAEGSFEIKSEGTQITKFTTSASYINVCDQDVVIDCEDTLICGYYLYKNDTLIASSQDFSNYIVVDKENYESTWGKYKLEVYIQGYKYVAQMGPDGYQYVPVATGSKTWKTFTLYTYGPYTTTQAIWLTALTPQEIDFRTLYLDVTANENANLFPQTWKSSDESVATVNNGVLTLHKAGNATVTLQIGNLQATWNIKTEALNIRNSSAVYYNTALGSVHIIYDNELLEEGTDYTVATKISNGVIVATIQGKGLFGGKVVKLFDANTGKQIACKHSYNKWVDMSNGKHKMICTVCLEEGKEAHKYDNANDIDCNYCQAVRKIKGHRYSSNCDTSCNDCDTVRTVTIKHTFDSSKACQLCDATFVDISGTTWQIDPAIYAYNRDLMTGKGTDINGNIKFDPDSPISREEFVQVLYNAEGKPSVDFVYNFLDVKDTWYKNAVLWAKKNDIANGTPDGNFGVGKNITRQDLALMLYKYAKIKGCSLEAEEGKINQFADGNKVAEYAKTAMDWAVTNGVLSGKGEAGKPIFTFKLDPTGTATRAECAAMLKNFMEAFGL